MNAPSNRTASIVGRLLHLIGRVLPRRLRTWLFVHARPVWPPIGMVRFGSLRRLTPIGAAYGQGRGKPIDRYYIEDFLARHAGNPGYVLGDVQGRVMEIGEDTYTRRHGTIWESDPAEAPPGYVSQIDILHGDDSNPTATLVGDLSSGDGIPSDTFDCIICTQTLLLLYDVKGAVETLHRALKPGGTALVTVPGISKLCRPDYDLWGDYWRFTTLSSRRLFSEFFPAENVSVEAHGNVLSTTAMLHGLAAEDLRPAELDLRDPDYELLITIRAVKAG